ncbi:MAG: phospholipase D-like domain-containing protein [Bacteroidota bacterium]
MNKIFAIVLFLFFQINLIVAQSNIAEARTYAQGLGVSVTGIVINGDELGPIRYIQDATAGIPFYDPAISSGINPGDEVTIVGEIGDFNGLLQVVNVLSHTINSTGNPLPTPQVVTPDGLNGDTEAELVTINNVIFTDAGSGAQFTGNTTFGITANGEFSQIFVRSGSPLVGKTIPETLVNLTGIVSVFNGSYQLLLRDEADIDGKFVDNIRQDNITTTSFDISWTSNFSGSTNLRYGTAPNDLSNEINLGGTNLTHAVSLSGLSPATFYYVQVFSEDGSTTAQSAVRVFSTVSESTGIMKIFFNNVVDTSFSTGVDAVGISGGQMEAEIISYIDNAQNTIDMAIYNINRIPIVTALNNAVNRGVQVRYIANSGTLNSALQDGEAIFNNISLNAAALMHNKFMVVDVASVNDCWVMSGSANMTSQNLGDDFNNILFIQDQSLAKAYTLEFEEMWGGDSPTPSIFGVKVGDQKEDNTPHNFIIGGELVESYFSPSDNTTNAISNALKTAETDLEFATLTLTMNDMRDALFDADANGAYVRGLIENTSDIGSDFDVLSANLDVKDHPADGSIHHKYGIVDATNPTSDPMVITGSHNWSASAENINDENTLIIHSATVANIFLQEFEARWAGLVTAVEGVANIEGFEVEIMPNPVRSVANVKMNLAKSSDVVVTLWTMNGRQLQAQIVRNVFGNEWIEMNVSGYPNGHYLLSFRIGDAITSKQLIIQK